MTCEMTENRRIFLNIIATYGRSLYTLCLGLLCGRWALMALGELDYGLNGLVGGLAIFISFVNTVLASASARFYAFSIGAARIAKDKSEALEECRRWFNTAFSIHLVVPLALICVGYPIGVYAIRHWLTIPALRVDSCVWVFRFVCLSCFVGMLNAPFQAMYGAKQYIAELTIYGFCTSTLNVLGLYYMVSHPGFWLTRYAAWTCALSVVPQILICIRACCVFPECKIIIGYMWDLSYLKKLGSFSAWQMIGIFCGMLRTQGMTIVINKFFGAAMNAAQTIGNTVQSHCNTLAAAMQSAFVPVITQSCGSKDYVKMNEFVIRMCKFNVALSAIFMIPLALELPIVMKLWLKTPPDYATGLCYCAMLFHLVDCCTTGYMVSINAIGKIAQYQVVINTVSVMTIPFAVVAGLLWRNVYVVISAQIVVATVVSLGRIFFARKLAFASLRKWLSGVLFPVAIAVGVAAAFGSVPRIVLGTSFSRLCLTTLVCEIIYLPLLWLCVLSASERQYIALKVRSRLAQFIG